MRENSNVAVELETRSNVLWMRPITPRKDAGRDGPLACQKTTNLPPTFQWEPASDPAGHFLRIQGQGHSNCFRGPAHCQTLCGR